MQLAHGAVQGREFVDGRLELKELDVAQRGLVGLLELVGLVVVAPGQSGLVRGELDEHGLGGEGWRGHGSLLSVWFGFCKSG